MPRKDGNVTKSFTYEGKRYYVTGTSETDAEVKKALKLRDLEEGKVIINKAMTVRQWAEICMETYKKPTQKEITYQKYQNRMKNCVLDVIGDMPIKNVRTITCQQVLNRQQGNSEYQIKQTRQMLHFLFKYAVKEKLILENPAEDLIEPEGTKQTRRSLTSSERAHFLKVMDMDPRFLVFQLMYYASCRPDEAREVRGRDVQLKNGYPVIHVRGHKTDRHNDKSDRYVPIPMEFYEKVKRTPPFSCVAPSSSGNKMDDKAYQRAWESLCREMNISMGCKTYRNKLLAPFPLAEDLVPYCLRHTFCTDLQKKGVDIRTAQYLMGHSDIKMTANIYTHADDETILSAAEILCNVAPVSGGVVPRLQTVEK